MEKKLRLFDLEAVRSEANSPVDEATIVPAERGFEIGPGVHKGTIKGIVWTLDHNIIVTVADDKLIRWWSLAERRVVQEYPVTGDFGSCEFSTAAQNSQLLGKGLPILVVTAGRDVMFFGGHDAREHYKTITFPYEVASAALHPDQRKLVVGAMKDTWVKVYDFDTERETGMFITALLIVADRFRCTQRSPRPNLEHSVFPRRQALRNG